MAINNTIVRQNDELSKSIESNIFCLWIVECKIMYENVRSECLGGNCGCLSVSLNPKFENLGFIFFPVAIPFLPLTLFVAQQVLKGT